MTYLKFYTRGVIGVHLKFYHHIFRYSVIKIMTTTCLFCNFFWARNETRKSCKKDIHIFRREWALFRILSSHFLLFRHKNYDDNMSFLKFFLGEERDQKKLQKRHTLSYYNPHQYWAGRGQET
jgi:hypothetical protein